MKISEQFEFLLEGKADDKVTLGYLLQHFGRRSYGLIMLVLALPNMIPIYIPGLSVICGLPIFLLGYQLFRQRPHPSLPDYLQSKSFVRADLIRVITRALPALKKIETVLRPRWSHLTTRNIEALVGLGIMFLSAFMLLPLPATNIGPAFGIAILALGMTEEDGFFIAIGSAVGVAASIVTVVIIGMYMALGGAGLSYLF